MSLLQIVKGDFFGDPQGKVPTNRLLRKKMGSFQRMSSGQSLVCVQKSCLYLKETSLPRLWRAHGCTPPNPTCDCKLRNKVMDTVQAQCAPQIAFLQPHSYTFLSRHCWESSPC